jgi:hypothetical protein
MWMIALWMAALATAGPTPGSLIGELRLDAAKADMPSSVALTCIPAGRLEVPARRAEVCRASLEGGELVAMFAADQEGVSRMVAYALRGEGLGFDRLRQSMAADMGAPTRRSQQPWGESLVWLQGARQISLRSACAAQTPCLEISKDMTARRMARSGGVFVQASPGS